MLDRSEIRSAVEAAGLIVSSNGNQPDIVARIADAISDQIEIGMIDDPQMFAAEFNFRLSQERPYAASAYRQTMPSFDAGRISPIAAEHTPPADLVALAARGFTANDQRIYEIEMAGLRWKMVRSSGFVEGADGKFAPQPATWNLSHNGRDGATWAKVGDTFESADAAIAEIDRIASSRI